MKRWLTAATVLTVAISGVVFWQATSKSPLLRLGVPGQWVWKYDHSPYSDRAVYCLAGAALLGWLCYTTRNRAQELIGGRVSLFLLGAIGLCFWIQATFPYVSKHAYGQAVLWMGTPKANADFDEACKAGALADLLKEYQDPNRPFRIHISTHPPGPVLFYVVQKRCWEAAPEAAEHFVSAMQLILPFAAEAQKELPRQLSSIERATLYSSMLLLWLAVALGVVPLYFWAAEMFGPPSAVVAVAFYSLTPSFLLFNPMTDQLYVPVSVALLALYHLGLARRDPGQLAFAGALTWLALQFTLAFLAVLFVIAVQVGLEIKAEGRARDMLRLLAWAGAGFVVLLLLFLFLPQRYNCLVVWKLCLANNAQFNLGRTYLPWVIYNPIDFVLFLGVPTAVFFVREAIVILRRRAEETQWRLVVALLATIALVNFAGINRGEVARLWMVFMPVAAAVAAHSFRPREEEEEPERDWTFPIAYGLLFVQTALFKMSLDLLLPVS